MAKVPTAKRGIHEVSSPTVADQAVPKSSVLVSLGSDRNGVAQMAPVCQLAWLGQVETSCSSSKPRNLGGHDCYDWPSESCVFT